MLSVYVLKIYSLVYIANKTSKTPVHWRLLFRERKIVTGWESCADDACTYTCTYAATHRESWSYSIAIYMKHSNHIPTSSAQVHELALQVTLCVLESVDSCTHHLCYQVNDTIFFWAYAHLWRLTWIDITGFSVRATSDHMMWPAVFAWAATVKVIGCSSLRGGGGELGTNKNFDLWLQLVCTKLKLKHAI